jgi:hypothetical protein
MAALSGVAIDVRVATAVMDNAQISGGSCDVFRNLML